LQAAPGLTLAAVRAIFIKGFDRVKNQETIMPDPARPASGFASRSGLDFGRRSCDFYKRFRSS
jgi:hypothetical protein